MSVNGVSSSMPTSSASAASTRTASNAASTQTAKPQEGQNSGVVYESEKGSAAKQTTYKPNTELVNKMKADAEARSSQLKGLVEKLFKKQGEKFNQANMWDALRTGKLQVDPATAAQAKADIAEDGYYGVEKTSDRFLEFAKALTGGDPSKADDMLKAFKKGYEAATKSWGSKLPDISKQTYDKTLEKFEAWKNEGKVEA